MSVLCVEVNKSRGGNERGELLNRAKEIIRQIRGENMMKRERGRKRETDHLKVMRERRRNKEGGERKRETTPQWTPEGRLQISISLPAQLPLDQHWGALTAKSSLTLPLCVCVCAHDRGPQNASKPRPCSGYCFQLRKTLYNLGWCNTESEQIINTTRKHTFPHWQPHSHHSEWAYVQSNNGLSLQQ